MDYLIAFLIWTFVAYWTHRIVHSVQPFKDWHADHHRTVDTGQETGRHWSNYFFWVDSWKSTLDFWVVEIIPLAIVCWLMGTWLLFVPYWIWVAFLQEKVEHDPTFRIPGFTSGTWHMVHHSNCRTNFGTFIPIWDKLFGTYAAVVHLRK